MGWAEKKERRVVGLMAGASFEVLLTVDQNPIWEGRRETGLSLYGSVLLWAAAVAKLQHKGSEDASSVSLTSTRRHTMIVDPRLVSNAENRHNLHS
jgi:hypothetical protein